MMDAAEVVTLAPALGLGEAEVLHAELVARLLAGGPIMIDGSSVDRITTPAIQVLLACSRAAAAADRTVFTLTAASDSMVEAFRLLGLSAELEAWCAPDGAAG